MPKDPPAGKRFFASIDLFDLLAPRRIDDGADPTDTQDEDEAEVPDLLTIPLLPEGKFEHPWYGILNWTPAVFEEMCRNFQARVTGYEPCLNFDHSSQNPFAASAPAAGWITELVVNPGVGLDAKVALTPGGKRAVQDREYRYISAEVADAYTDSQGLSYANVVVGAALTNQPFHDTMRGLFSEKAPRTACFSKSGPHSFWAAVTSDERKAMSLIEKLRKRFSLPDTADEAAVAAALDADTEKPADDAAATAAAAAAAAAVTTTPAVPAVVPPADTTTLSRAEIETLKAAAGKVTALETQITTLGTRLKAAEDRGTAAEEALALKGAGDLVDGYIRSGKVLAAQRETALEFARSNPALFKKTYEAALPQIDLTQRGLGNGDADVVTDSFEGAVGQVMLKKPDLDYAEAAEIVASEKPDLYERYRQAQMGRRAS